MTAITLDADVDSLIGGFQSVYAGDRGHAIRDLRDTLFASLGHVALGPTVEPASPNHSSPAHTLSSGPSPSPPAGLLPSPGVDHFAPLPSPALQRPTPSTRSRSGSHGQRQPPSSPVRSVTRGNKYGRKRAEPYNRTTRPQSNVQSRVSTRHTSPDNTCIAAVLAEINPCSHFPSGSRSHSRVQPYRSRSASSVSTASNPPRPTSSHCSMDGTSTGATSPALGPFMRNKATSPGWGATLSFTPMHHHCGDPLPAVSTPSGYSSLENMLDSTASSTSGSALNLPLNTLPACPSTYLAPHGGSSTSRS